MAKSKPTGAAPAPKHFSQTIAAEVGKPREAQLAGLASAASVPSALVIADFSKPLCGEIPLIDLLGSLDGHADRIEGGDLGRIESMLGGQAAALNTMFAELARRGALNMNEYIEAAETFLKLALRAQNQCRATLETLAAIKNPPTIFAKQANIAHGPQQVNNASQGIARAEQTEKPQTELLEHRDGERLDGGTTSTTSGSHTPVAAMGTVNRTADGRWKDQS